MRIQVKPQALAWLAVVTFAVFVDPAATSAIVLAMVIHELAHAIAAKIVGCKVDGITFGYYPAVRIYEPKDSAKNAWIALSAPALNFFLFLVFGFAFYPLLAAGQLSIGVLAVLPYPGSDSWRAAGR